MLKNMSFYAVLLLLIVAFLTAGCAKQDVVKKDEGIAPAIITKKVDPPQSKAIVAPSKQAVVETTSSKLSTHQQLQNTASTVELQSALVKIYFDFDSATLSASSRSTLGNNAAALAKDTNSKIRIEGNCDERGSAEYNLALGERRAKAAQQYLVTMGVKLDRLSILSYGKEKPVVQGSDESAWAKNRRDEFVVLTK